MGPCHALKASQNNNSICRIRVGRMNQLERDELKDKLDDFSRRLDAEVRNWKERGEFTDTVRRLIDDIRRRRDQIEKKLELWLNQKVRLGMLLKSKRNGISAHSSMICSRSVND